MIRPARAAGKKENSRLLEHMYASHNCQRDEKTKVFADQVKDQHHELPQPELRGCECELHGGARRVVDKVVLPSRIRSKSTKYYSALRGIVSKRSLNTCTVVERGTA